MSTEALLTLLGLLVALVALLPAERLLDLRLRVRNLDVLVIVAALAFVHYVKFFPVLNSLGVPDLGPWRWGFGPETASYLAILVAALVFAVRIRSARLHPRRIAVFQDLAESLLFSGRFAELLFLLERYLPALRRLIEGKHALTRLRNWIRPPDAFEQFMRDRVAGKRRGAETRARSAVRRIRLTLADSLPNHDQRGRQAGRLFERVLLHEPFVSYITNARPYLGLRVLEVEKPFFRESFLKMFVVSLLNNPNGVLYEEVRQNQNTAGSGRYVIDPLNPLVSYFFDANFRAEQVALYKPVGDAVLERLEQLSADRSSDPYRRTTRDYVEVGKWRCPIYISLSLFEFMVSEGLHRGVHWHLWLMYTDYWTEQIVKNLADVGPEIDQRREFPTAYHYLLYEIVDTQRSWVMEAAELDQNLASVKIDRVDLEPGNIAKSAAIAMASSLRTVLESPHLLPKFKGYLLDVVAHGYVRVAESGNDQLKEVLKAALAAGGKDGRDDAAFLRGLREALGHCDQVRHSTTPAEELMRMLKGRVGQT